MDVYKVNTIDDIKRRYKYTIDPSDFLNMTDIINDLFYGKFYGVYKRYNFDENIKIINKIIQNKKDKIDKNTLESYDKTLKEIADNSEKIFKKVNHEFFEISLILVKICRNYRDNKDIPGASDIYIKISTDLLDKEAKKYINYEKLLLFYNDNIINIKKNLSN